MNIVYQTLNINVQVHLSNYIWWKEVNVLYVWVLFIHFSSEYCKFKDLHPVACIHSILSLNYCWQSLFPGGRTQSPQMNTGELMLRWMPVLWLSVQLFHHKTKQHEIVKTKKGYQLSPETKCLASWFAVINLRKDLVSVYFTYSSPVTSVNVWLAFIWFTYHTVHSFKIHNSVGFRIFTKLCTIII